MVVSQKFPLKLRSRTLKSPFPLWEVPHTPPKKEKSKKIINGTNPKKWRELVLRPSCLPEVPSKNLETPARSST